MAKCLCKHCDCQTEVHEEVTWCDKCRYEHNEPKHFCKCDIPYLGDDLPIEQRPLFAMYCGDCGGKLLH